MIFKRIQEDIDAILERDPAARSRLEVWLCYSGLHAFMVYRVAHVLWRRGWFLGARMVSQLGRLLTGVEIHPGAKIGRRLVIDHGHGLVIGETSEIGEDVTLYHGVTLGGIAPSVDSHNQKNIKRHPTLQDDVIVGSGAQILGPVVVGKGARVGANAVVTKDVPAGVTATGVPAHVVMPKDRSQAGQFWAYGTPSDGCPDPVLASVEGLRGQVSVLLERIEELEARLQDVEEIEANSHPIEVDEKKQEPAVMGAGKHR
jgi:serine O-acetyltransferase